MNAAVKTASRHASLTFVVSAMSLALAAGIAESAASAPDGTIRNSLLASGPPASSAEFKPYPDGPAASGELALLSSRIADAFPGDFTRSLTDETGTGTIWFTGAVPPEAAEWSAAVDGVVLASDAGYSGRELEDYTSRLLASSPPDGISIIVTPVESERVIHVTLGPSDGDATLPDTAAAQASMEMFLSSNPPPGHFRVQFARIDQQIATPEDMPSPPGQERAMSSRTAAS